MFPEAGDSEFQALLDIWFPEKKPLPTAFLVDTSEEALLLPDWLKLRMIRSEVPRLVDAGTARLGGAGGPSCWAWTRERAPCREPLRPAVRLQCGGVTMSWSRNLEREGKGWGPQGWFWKDVPLGSTWAGKAAGEAV